MNDSHQPHTVTVTLANTQQSEETFDNLWNYSVGKSGNLNLNLFSSDKGMTHITYAPGTWLRLDYV